MTSIETTEGIRNAGDQGGNKGGPKPFLPGSGTGLTLKQRGRSGMEFLGALQTFSSSALRQKAFEAFEATEEGQQLVAEAKERRFNEPWSDRIEKTRQVAERFPAYRFERLYQRYVAEEVYVRSIPAIEEIRPEAERVAHMEVPERGASLELVEGFQTPDFYDGVEWHCAPGGYAGYELSGPMFMAAIGPYVFRYGGYAAVEVGDNIVDQRAQVLSQLPKDHYDVIYEMGCGGASTLSAAHRVYPGAKLIGSDVEAELLKGGVRAANIMGLPITFKQRDCRDTGEPDNSVDAVVSYALFHEMPVSACREALEEAFRILKPGGDMVISDPPPFAAVHPLQALVLDWDNDNRDEPFFHETCATEWTEVMKEIGFVNVEARILGERGYPYVTLGSKPE